MSSSTPQRLPGIAVYCASSLGNEKAFESAAISLGKAIASAGRPLIYGGGARGMMGIVSKTALDYGGKVVGVVPYAMASAGGEREKTDKEVQSGTAILSDERNKEQYETIVVSSMHERKQKMAARAGGFVGLPGGYGTFEEVLEAITWNQLDIHNKPVVLLNVLSYYTPLKELISGGMKAGFIQPFSHNMVVFVDGPSNLSEHESFDWGTETLHALDSWTREPSAAFLYDWSKRIDSGSEETTADREKSI